MLSFIDNLLNRITMYRLVLYVMIGLITAAIIFSFTGLLPYSPWDLIYSVVVLCSVSLLTNWIFAKIFGIAANAESDYITALILALIITPGSSLLFLVATAALSQASKYLLAFRGKQIFNPAAIAVVLSFIFLGEGASWWIGNQYILPLVLVGGFFVARKIQRFDLVWSFLIIYFITLIFNTTGTNAFELVKLTLINSGILFFSFIMLTEPATTPPRKIWRIAYGALVGIILGSGFTFWEFYASPELALVLGNIFSFIVSDKARYKLTLKEKKEIAAQTYNFIFESNRKLTHAPGQYLEWTVGHKKSDTRGNRRYFTIASSPTENHVDLGVKFYDNPSTFKKALIALNIGDQVFAGQLSGEFTLPADPAKKLAFIAGGIGITPFRSMLKYLSDKNAKRDVVLFYAANSEADFTYKDILDGAKTTGSRVIYKTDRLTADAIKKELPDYLERTFYISGPHSMVDVFEKILKEMGVPRSQIKIDFFPGYV